MHTAFRLSVLLKWIYLFYWNTAHFLKVISKIIVIIINSNSKWQENENLLEIAAKVSFQILSEK